MISRKSNLVVAVTTFNNELLRISIPALGKINRKFHLIIFNDNPTTTLTRRDVRALGYHGDVEIINSDENIGTLRARLGIIMRVAKMRTKPEWIVFCDDDDMLVNLDTPNVSTDNFAVIQNALVLRHRVADLLRAMTNPSDIVADDENITMLRPHVSFSGTLIRANIAIGMAQTLMNVTDKIIELEESIDYRPPVDAAMWVQLNTYTHHTNPDATPIYMDKINYISNQLDSAPIKYGRAAMPARATNSAQSRAVARYDALMRDALHITVAAPAGQN